MLPWSTQYGISLYDWWLLIYRLPVAHCPVFIGGRNRLGPSFSADSRVSVSQSIITRELAPPAPLFPLSPFPLPPCPLSPFPPAPTRASSPSISSFFSVCRTTLSLCVSLRVISLPLQRLQRTNFLSLCPLSPTSRSQSRSLGSSPTLSPTLSPTIPTPPRTATISRRVGQCIVRGSSQRFGAPAAATSCWTRTPPGDISGDTPLRLVSQEAKMRPTMIKRAPTPTTATPLFDGRIDLPWHHRWQMPLKSLHDSQKKTHNPHPSLALPVECHCPRERLCKHSISMGGMRPSDYLGTLPHTILGRDRATAMAMRILTQCRTQPIGSISRDLSVVTRPTSPVRCGSGAEPDRPQCARQRHHHDHGHDSLYPGIKLKRSDIFWSPLVSASCFSAGSGSAARRKTRQSPWLPVAPDVTVDRGPREIDAFLPPPSFYQCGKCCMVRRGAEGPWSFGAWWSSGRYRLLRPPPLSAR